jgi:acyl dehydratase
MPHTSVTFDRLPSMIPAYARVILGKKPYYAADVSGVQPFGVEARSVVISARHVRRYRAACGMQSGDSVPVSFPHVLSMPLHMQLFVTSAFPVKVLGLIHLRNSIRWLKPVPTGRELQLRVDFDCVRQTDTGQEYDLITRYRDRGEVIWEEVSTMFARNPNAVGKRERLDRSTHPAEGDVKLVTADIDVKTGWRYAKVSGDFNPIHLTARTAKMFGFKQAVAHGMWSMARCLAEAEPQLPAGKIRVDTQFKLPVYLPSQALVRVWPMDRGLDISMATPRGDRLHLAMQVLREG